MSTAKEIAALNDAMCVADVALENLDGGLQPTPYQRSLIALAAEVRRLREENERQHFDILAMNQSLDLMREENERLRGWIRVEGACNDTCTRQILGEICDGCRCGKAQKDAARGAQ